MIRFIYEWGRGDPKLAWSGVPWSLETAIRKKTEVLDLPIPPENGAARVMRKLLAHTVYGGSDCRIAETKRGIRAIQKMDLSRKAPNLVFLEYPTRWLGDCYIYEDLSMDFLTRFGKSHPELLKYTPLNPKANQRAVDIRTGCAQAFNARCRGIFTMSKWLAGDLIRSTGIDPERVHWAGGGSNIDTSKIDLSGKEGKRFLFIGRRWERKGGDLVTDAFRRVREKYPDAELYVAGPEKDPTGGQDGVFFLGPRSYDDLIRYFNLCDFFVMPSRFEAYGLVYIEALAFGLPCIARDQLAGPEIVKSGENGFLVEKDDAEELAFRMVRLMEEPGIRKNVLRDRETYRKEYSWDAVADRMIEVFRRDGYDV